MFCEGRGGEIMELDTAILFSHSVLVSGSSSMIILTPASNGKKQQPLQSLILSSSDRKRMIIEGSQWRSLNFSYWQRATP